MSEQKLVSPLLDGFIMGDAISNHDGVRCYPAIKENSDDKYIVKIISVPASQKQLDALLLTGACKDAGAAMEYFKERADEVVTEAQLLQQLSKLEGFLPYDNWQIVPMEQNNLGYLVYLVGSYKRSLEKYLQRNTMTHLGAVNLGLDICSALSVCRRAGFIHVDLKPSNIFFSGEEEHRIGDLGFVKLSSLKYAALPSKYRSKFTPPELHDEMATLNPTVDIYALGLILYQIYNNGKLPFDIPDFTEPLNAPANADSELAEIILKAVHPNPRHRWQSPIEMGQALANYMQNNEVTDEPIFIAAEPEEEVSAPVETENISEEPAEDEENVLTAEEVPASDENASDDTTAGEELQEELADATTLMLDQPAEESRQPDSDPAVEENEEIEAEEADEEDDDYDSEEIDKEFFKELFAAAETYDEDEDDDDEDYFVPQTTPVKKRRGWIGAIVVLLVLALLAGGTYYYYTNYYLLPIDKMDISTAEDTITVNLTTNVDESLLTVICSDAYGNSFTQSVTGGKAVFTGLNSGTLYNIAVEAEGFHQTCESISGSCATVKQTEIVEFTAKTGNEDGSVILNFAVNGPETQDWLVTYATEGEEEQSVTFTGHMATITGLTVGQSYTFTLVPATESDMWIVGTNVLEYTASRIVVAENLTVIAGGGGSLTAIWDVPADEEVEYWNVRCYSESGYDQTITVTEPLARFNDIVDNDAYTLEVTAAGMTQNIRTFVTANPTTVTNIQVKAEKGLTVTWDYTGNAPEGGWLLLYSVNSGKTTDVIKCDDTTAVIDSVIPGANYQLTIQAANGSTVFDGTSQFTCPEAKTFDQYGLSVADIMVSLCKTPEKENWTYEDVSEYPGSYTAGTKVSMVLYASGKFNSTDADVKVTFIIRDAAGNVLTELLSTRTMNWKDLWHNRYAYLDISALPEEAGDYTINLYFDDQYVLTKKITIK